MARPGPGEGPGDDREGLSVERQALDILSDSRQILARGAERFRLRDNPREHELKTAVLNLGSASLAKLAAGEDIAYANEGDGTLSHVADLWSGEETSRRVYGQARALYEIDRASAIKELLEGKILEAVRREGAEPYVMEAVGGALTGEAPERVIGVFKEAQIGNGMFILLPVTEGEAAGPGAHWNVRPFGYEGTGQQVDISVVGSIDR